MIKVQATLLKFDTNDTIGVRFCKDCVCNFGQTVPITAPDHFHTVGMTESITRNDSSIVFDGVIHHEEISSGLQPLIKDQLIYCGGYYRINKDHKENGLRVIDDLTLLSIGLYVDDIYGDKTTILTIKEETCGQ